MKQIIGKCPGLERKRFLKTHANNQSFIHANSFASGQILVLVAIAILVLFGFVALALDISLTWGTRRRMQTAADAAALAGAVASRLNQDVTAAADSAAALNGFANGTAGVTVTIVNPYSDASCTQDCVKVAISQPQSTYFLRTLGFNQINVAASAVAGSIDSSTCFYALGSSPGLTVSGNANINLSCGAAINSSATCSGNGFFKATSIGIADSVSTQDNCSFIPSPNTGISAVADPFSYLGSQPACSGGGIFIPGVSGPGSYCGGIRLTGNTTLTLQPGIYNLGSGGLTITGNVNINGTGVTFITSGPINISSNVTATLSAPTSGSYEGILFWSTSTGGSSITGNSNSTFDGTFYFPNSSLSYTGNSSNSGYTIIAAAHVLFQGNATIKNNYSSLAHGSPAKSSTLYE